jgi:hypothetical protein
MKKSWSKKSRDTVPLNMDGIRFRIQIRNRKWNWSRDFSKVGTGTALNLNSSPTLLSGIWPYCVRVRHRLISTLPVLPGQPFPTVQACPVIGQPFPTAQACPVIGQPFPIAQACPVIGQPFPTAQACPVIGQNGRNSNLSLHLSWYGTGTLQQILMTYYSLMVQC